MNKIVETIDITEHGELMRRKVVANIYDEECELIPIPTEIDMIEMSEKDMEFMILMRKVYDDISKGRL